MALRGQDERAGSSTIKRSYPEHMSRFDRCEPWSTSRAKPSRLAVCKANPTQAFKSTSMAGLQGAFNLSPYVASKWAVIGITRTAAMELGSRGIRVNAICPTSVNTPMANTPEGQPQLNMERKAISMGRIAEPQEIAAMIHFLAATDCNFVNGQAIACDGGFSAGMSPVAYETLAAV